MSVLGWRLATVHSFGNSKSLSQKVRSRGSLPITSQLLSGNKTWDANLGTVVTNMSLKFSWHAHDGGPQQVTYLLAWKNCNQPVSYRMWEGDGVAHLIALDCTEPYKQTEEKGSLQSMELPCKVTSGT